MNRFELWQAEAAIVRVPRGDHGELAHWHSTVLYLASPQLTKLEDLRIQEVVLFLKAMNGVVVECDAVRKNGVGGRTCIDLQPHADATPRQTRSVEHAARWHSGGLLAVQCASEVMCDDTRQVEIVVEVNIFARVDNVVEGGSWILPAVLERLNMPYACSLMVIHVQYRVLPLLILFNEVQPTSPKQHLPLLFANDIVAHQRDVRVRAILVHARDHPFNLLPRKPRQGRGRVRLPLIGVVDRGRGRCGLVARVLEDVDQAEIDVLIEAGQIQQGADEQASRLACDAHCHSVVEAADRVREEEEGQRCGHYTHLKSTNIRYRYGRVETNNAMEITLLRTGRSSA